MIVAKKELFRLGLVSLSRDFIRLTNNEGPKTTVLRFFASP
jgi:hypothetical protein